MTPRQLHAGIFVGLICAVALVVYIARMLEL